jgi:hypothetical protein
MNKLLNFANRAKQDQPIYIHEVQKTYESLSETFSLTIVLTLFDDTEKHFVIVIPKFSSIGADERKFTKSYVLARIYNMLSALGGRSVACYYDMSDLWHKELFSHLNEFFQVTQPKNLRNGYGKVVNVLERMNENLCSDTEKEYDRFQFILHPIETYIPLKNDLNQGLEQSLNHELNTIERFKQSTIVDNKIICGVDIGGTDIKIAVSKGTSLLFLKEYDWYPTSFTLIEQLINPITSLMELMLANLEMITDVEAFPPETQKLIVKAMRRDSSLKDIINAITAAKEAFGSRELKKVDRIGLCFPDIVIHNKIVGGEVYKTRGIRDNNEIDYEVEFKKLSSLHVALEPYCSNLESIHFTNDGPMAAFTAGVEMAYSPNSSTIENGVFAHTLGTELGSGWIDEHGMIPNIPLEIYNFIIDLGNMPEKVFPPDDLRSINNFNTNLSGTLQKYTSQSGIFRLAIKYFSKSNPALYLQLEQLGFIRQDESEGKIILKVPTEPVDMRKPFLEHIMNLTSENHYDECDQIFIDIGTYLAATWIEIEEILSPKVKDRYLFGRLVKNPRCFSLIEKGFNNVIPEVTLFVADDTLANTPLMQQLKEDEMYTVAQFAQAVGAIYFGNAIQ